MKLYKKIIISPDNASINSVNDANNNVMVGDFGNNNNSYNNNNDKFNEFDEYKLISEELLFADNFFSRLLGLIFKNLKNNQGFVIENCSSIHTFWMRYKIDLIFLNKNNEIVKLYESFKQFRLTPLVKGAVKVIELPAFTIKNNALKKGDILKIS